MHMAHEDHIRSPTFFSFNQHILDFFAPTDMLCNGAFRLAFSDSFAADICTTEQVQHLADKPTALRVVAD